METLRNDTVHTSESMLSRIKHIDELTKEKEEELLYGGTEDGDEEEALSDDSMRLRLSDDEDAEPEEPLVTEPKKDEEKKEKDPNAESESTRTDAESSNVQEKDKPEGESVKSEPQEEENGKDDSVESTVSASKEKLIKAEDVEAGEVAVTTDQEQSEGPTEAQTSSSHEPEEKAQLVSNIQCRNTSDKTKCHETEVSEEKDAESADVTILDEKLVKKTGNQEPTGSASVNINQNGESKELCVPKVNDSDDASDKKSSQETNEVLSDDLELVCVKSNSSKDDLTVGSTIGNSTAGNKIGQNDAGGSDQDQNSDGRLSKNENLMLATLLSKPLKESEKTNLALVKETLSSDKKEDVVKQENNVKKDSVPVNTNSTINNATLVTDTKSSDSSEKKSSEASVANRRGRRSKKIIAGQEAAVREDKQVRESGRQKRRTAKNAEEIIRKKFLNHDSDLESSDGSDKFVIINPKMSQGMQPLSPPSLKRTLPDSESAAMNGGLKKIKTAFDTSVGEVTINDNHEKTMKHLNYVHKFFQRDLKEKLPKLKQEELEELLIQKIVETITMHSEIGKLREQARISERNQEAMRARCQQLSKQIKDFEMVLSRNAADRRANNDRPTPPIKINRSVGLQVNFMTEHGMQNLRQLQQNNVKTHPPSNNNNNNNNNTSSVETNNNAVSPRRGIKVRSPRRSDGQATPQPVPVTQNHVQSPQLLSAVTPAALVVAKPLESQHAQGITGQTTNLQQILPNPQQGQTQQQPPQTIVLNGKLPGQIGRHSTTLNVNKSKPSDLIDLTDEEEKSKATVNVPTVTTQVVDPQLTTVPKTQQCFQRVIQAIPGNMTIASQPASIRVVQPASQPTPTALVNNMNAPRLAYVMQSGVGSTRQLLITSNSNPIRPVTSCNRASFSTLTYKTGTSIANGTVRVLTTSATTNVQLNKHPAPLPDTPGYVMNPAWKLPPPAPSLKISKVANGIVLSWNMTLSDRYADIASYQLYAYQEIAGAPPSTGLWKKVGDVRALPLPMACTLTQFSEGNNYYFAVRAVDTHSRKGPYSIPGNISL